MKNKLHLEGVSQISANSRQEKGSTGHGRIQWTVSFIELTEAVQLEPFKASTFNFKRRSVDL